MFDRPLGYAGRKRPGRGLALRAPDGELSPEVALFLLGCAAPKAVAVMVGDDTVQCDPTPS